MQKSLRIFFYKHRVARAESDWYVLKAVEKSEIMQRISVVLPLSHAGVYDYKLSPESTPPVGSVVRVPFQRRSLIGVVWDYVDPLKDEMKLRAVDECLENVVVSPELQELVRWVASYYCAPLGAVLRMVMPVPTAFDPVAPKIGVQLAENWQAAWQDVKQTAQRHAVVETMQESVVYKASVIADKAGVGVSVLKTLEKSGVLTSGLMQEISDGEIVYSLKVLESLNQDQKHAADALCNSVKVGEFKPWLLDGVTGSGKTEVYFEAVAEALRQGKQALVLIPEIALTRQWLERFERRFGVMPTQWHSKLSPGQRKKNYRTLMAGQARVVVGARSALFLPYKNLGVVIVDEEHEPSYKQEEGVRYNARDVAVMRAKFEKFPVVLATATPSIETYYNVKAGKYGHLVLKARFKAAQLPEISCIDLRKNAPGAGRWIAAPLVKAVSESLERGEQSLLFLNRRGFAPLTLCGACGHRFMCDHCSAWLVEHKSRNRLVCHHCGIAQPYPEVCPECDAEGSLKPCGPGVERITQEIKQIFPQARTALMSSDVLKTTEQMEQLIVDILERKVDIIIGTQMVAKGHHFPHLTCVGVIDADAGLSGGDLRASEKTFQLLYQVTGRAGRSERPGRAFIQTYQPERPLLKAIAALDREAYMREELAERQEAQMPPFGRLVAFIFSGEEQMEVKNFADAFVAKAPHDLEGVEIYGPSPAPISFLRGQYRFRVLMQVAQHLMSQKIIQFWMQQLAVPRNIQLRVDVDPYNFL